MSKNTGNARKQKQQRAALPVFPALATRMTVDFLFNESGEVWLLHDRPLPARLEWVEYDADMESVTLVTEEGKIQDIGIGMPPGFAFHLLDAVQITALHVEDKKIIDGARVPLVARGTSIN